MKYKDFFIDEGRYFIDAEEVSQAVFDERRLKECWHHWEPIGDSSKDGKCRYCELEVIGGHKQTRGPGKKVSSAPVR